MADLIDRQAAIDAIRELESGEDFNFNNGLICAMNNVAELPSADAVEVVRCRDCKYAKMGECEHKLGLIVANDENYCSYGVRKDD